jgi:hypothetical protein
MGCYLVRPFTVARIVAPSRVAFRSPLRPVDPGPASDGIPVGRADPSPGRLTWARLLRRVFAIQVLVCARCGGPRRILGAVTEPHAVRRLLAALGLAAEPPPARPITAA